MNKLKEVRAKEAMKEWIDIPGDNDSIANKALTLIYWWTTSVGLEKFLF